MKRCTGLGLGLVFICLNSVFATPPAGYGLLWSDEFDQPNFDTLKTWSYQVGGGSNAEQELYTKGSNLTIENGSAILWAKKENVTYSGTAYKYTSCRITSKNKKDFGYGYYEARIKTPFGKGLWPAFWLEGRNIDSVKWPNCGEIEMYETKTGPNGYNGGFGDSNFITTCHYGNASGNPVFNSSPIQKYKESLSQNYHLYAVKRTSLKYEYYFDDVKFWEFDVSKIPAHHQNFFFLANIAIGGDFQGQQIDQAIFPQKMYIDYIRVYQEGLSSVHSSNPYNAVPLYAKNPVKSRLVVYTVLGQCVADFTEKLQKSNGTVDALSLIKNMRKGVYIARLYENDKVYSRRVVVL